MVPVNPNLFCLYVKSVPLCIQGGETFTPRSCCHGYQSLSLLPTFPVFAEFECGMQESRLQLGNLCPCG